MSNHVLLPYSYFAPIEYIHQLMRADQITFEKHEYFEKQTYRNRCTIYGANGMLNLVVPVRRIKGTRQPMQDVRIMYAENWQKLHWKSFESAYRRSPYFEYYESDFRSLFEQKFEFLIDLDQASLEWVMKKLDLDIPPHSTTETYTKAVEQTDLRRTFHPKHETPSWLTDARYMQTFESKNGFLPNLSILDLLFNQGPAASSYLHNLKAEV